MTDVVWTRLAELVSGEYRFAWWAIGAAAAAGVFCGVVGVLLTLRRTALLGDAAAHATLPGLCAAFLLGGSTELPALLAGALCSSLAAALLVGWLDGRPRSRPEANVAGVLAFSFGLGAWLLTRVQQSTLGGQAGLTSFLFGSAAAVSPPAALALFGVSLALVALVFIGLRPLALATLDPAWAATVGVPTRLVSFALPAATAAAVVLAAPAVGVVLVAAMLVIAPAAALLVARSLRGALWLGGAVGCFSGVLGGVASFVVPRLSTGPAMVLAAAACFVAVLAGRATLAALGRSARTS